MNCSHWKETGCEDFPCISSWKETADVRSHCSCSMAGTERVFSPERDSLVGSSCCWQGWLEEILSPVVWAEWRPCCREVLLLEQSQGRVSEHGRLLVGRGSLTKSLPISGVLNQGVLWGLRAPGASGMSLGMDLIAGIAVKALCGFVCVECLFTLSNDDLYHD